MFDSQKFYSGPQHWYWYVMKNWKILPAIVFAVIVATGAATAGAKYRIKVGGTGASTGMSHIVADFYARAEKDATIDVVEGLGSGGGIRALIAGAVDISFSSRPLKDKESGKGVVARPLLHTPFVLMSSHPAPDPINSRSIPEILRDPRPQWSDGTPVKVILRPKAESDTKLLAGFFSAGEAIETARSRGDIPVAETDQDNAALAERLKGSLTTATLLQMLSEERALKTVPIDGIAPTVEALETNTYPYGKTLYVVHAEQPGPAVEALVSFLRSPEFAVELRRIGAVLVE